ncbi:MAG: TIGR02186 family protein [bacterium]
MRTKILAILTAFILAGAVALAQTAEEPPAANGGMVTDFTKGVIEIDVSYHGDRIHFFGTMAGAPTDAVIVKLTSPAETVKLNVAGRVGPFWMNVKQYRVENVPFMYKIHASDRLEQVLTPELAGELGIGFETLKDRLRLDIAKGTPDEKDRDTLFDGLMKLKKKSNLYRIDDDGRIKIKGGRIFQHYFTFPAAAKEGDYIVESFLIRDRQLVGRATDTIHIQKVGLEAFVAEAAQKRPLQYGICAVVIALGTGLLVGFIFKGGAH